MRKSFLGAGRSPWVGAQAGFAHMKSSGGAGEYDYSSSDSGWSGWVNAGLTLSQRVSIFGGGGVTGLWDGHGKNVRLGVEIRP